MKPVKNQILFKPFLIQEKSEGGIIVPDSYRVESDKGEIVDVGEGTKDRPMRLKKGEVGYRVHKWGTLVKKDGESYYLMEDNAILATTKQ